MKIVYSATQYQAFRNVMVKAARLATGEQGRLAVFELSQIMPALDDLQATFEQSGVTIMTHTMRKGESGEYTSVLHINVDHKGVIQLVSLEWDERAEKDFNQLLEKLSKTMDVLDDNRYIVHGVWSALMGAACVLKGLFQKIEPIWKKDDKKVAEGNLRRNG